MKESRDKDTLVLLTRLDQGEALKVDRMKENSLRVVGVGLREEGIQICDG